MNRPCLRASVLLPLVLLAAPALARGSAGGGAKFEVPRTALAFKLGGYFPSGDSDLWDFNSRVLTTEPDDFNDFAFGLEVQLRTFNHFEFSVDVEFYEGVDHSEDREFVDSAGFPILQRSELNLVPATFNVRWLPGGRYRRDAAGFLGVPRRVVPYLAVGGGLYLWEFEMEGDFVDPVTLEIFFDRFVSDGITLGATAAAGLEIPVSPAWTFLLEGRYHWAEDDLDEDFVGFDEFDLGGANFFVGATVQF